MPLAASLVGATGTSMVRADVALAAPDDAPEAVVGSFTVDGLTYAVDGEGQVALVAVAPLGEGAGAAEAADPADGAEGPGVEGEAAQAAGPALDLPGSVSYAGTGYSLVRIAPLALAACGAASLAIPASVTAVDTAAALGCETLERVAVDEASDSLATFDGYLTDKARTSILLVPEGRVGQLRIPSTTESIDPRVFSHCSRLDAFLVDADCPGLASWDGSLYTPDLSTLLRVPAGAEAVTLPPECTAIGASALSGCTALRAIEAQGSVTSIAPSAFGEVEEAQALPAAALGTAGDEAAEGERPVQLTGLVAVASSALSSIQIDKSAVTVTLAEGASPDAWQAAGFTVKGAGAASANTDADAAAADDASADLAPEGGTLAAAGTLAASIISEEVSLTEDDEPAAIQSAASYAATYDVIQAYEPDGRLPVYACTYSGSCYGRQYTYTADQGWTYRDFTGSSLSLGSISAHKFAGIGFWQFGNPAHDTTVTLLKSSATMRLNTLTDGSSTWSYVYSLEQWSSVASTSTTFRAASTTADGNLVSSIAAMPGYVPLEVCAVVTWDANGGTCETQASKALLGDSVQAPIASMKPGYEFAGWFDSLQGGRLVAAPGETFVVTSKDQTLYAHWEVDPLYQRLLDKYKEDKFLDPGNGVTAESLADGAYDALKKYGEPQQIGSVSAYWTFTEADDGELTLTIWCESGATVPRLHETSTPGVDLVSNWGEVMPYIERARMLDAGENDWPQQFDGHASANVTNVLAMEGMPGWFYEAIRLRDIDDVYLVGTYYLFFSSTATRDADVSFYYTFAGCKSLDKVPGSSMRIRTITPSSSTNITRTFIDFCYTFKDCTGLTELGEDCVMPNYTSAAFPSIRGMFQGCINLSKLPASFGMATKVWGWNDVFADCTSLVDIPASFTLSSMAFVANTSGNTGSSGYQTAVGFSAPYNKAFIAGSTADESLLATYYESTSLTGLKSSASSDTASELWCKNYGRRLVTRQANNALLFIPRMDATGDESIQSWVAVDAAGQPGTEAEAGIARGADGMLERPMNPASQRAGYTFGGWYKDPAYTEPFDFSRDYAEDYQCLWGRFVQGSSITYDLQGGSMAEGEEFMYQPSYTETERVIVDAVPVREGYEFLGWTIEGITGDEPQKQAIIPKGTAGDLVAVAHWGERHYLYTVKDGTGAAGSTSPKAWWELDGNGRLYIHCDTVNGETAVIAQRNFPGWYYNTPDKQEAWGAVRDQVRSIVLSEEFAVEQSASYTRSYVSANATSSSCYEALNQGMSWWFTWMPNLKDVSGVRISDGVACSGLFWGCWGLETLEGAYGTFQMPEACGNWNGILGCTGLKELPEGFTIPEGVAVIRCMFQGTPLRTLPDGFSLPSTLGNGAGAFKNCPELASLPTSLDLSQAATSVSFNFDGTQDVAAYPRDYVESYRQRLGGSLMPSAPIRTLYAGDLARLLPRGASGTAKAYWLSSFTRELVGPADLTAPQSAVRFQVPKEDGSGYVEYDVLTDASGRVSAPAVTRYGYSKVAWRYDTGTTGDDLGRIAAMGPCGTGSLSFDASALPEISPGLKGPVYAEVSGLMLSMDMPVGSGNLWYAIDCGEVIALGPSASARAGMADAHELAFESYTPVPTELCATFTANDAADGVPSAEKLFPSGIDEATGFSLSLDGGASVSAGFKGLIDSGGSQGFESLASLDASASVREPGRASGTLALKLGGANATDFAEETTEYSVAEVVWTLDASAQYDLYAADDAGVYGTSAIKDAAEAIAAFGASDAVPAYRQYHRYLEQDQTLSLRYADGSTAEARILGLRQDIRTAGGYAGITFCLKNSVGPVTWGPNNATATYGNGDIKPWLNTHVYAAMSSLVQESVVGVTKHHRCYSSGSEITGTVTYRQTLQNEKVFAPSINEVMGASYATNDATFQYEYFKNGGSRKFSRAGVANDTYGWWTRSSYYYRPSSLYWQAYQITSAGAVTEAFPQGWATTVPCFAF